MDRADLAAADQGGPDAGQGQISGKWRATIIRKNARDSAISSMPFIPSSMLIQPW